MNFNKLIFLCFGLASAVIEATDKDIDTYLSKNVPAIIDLYGTWCGHCKQFAPVFDELSDEFQHLSDKLQFIKVNVDNSRKTSKKFDLKYVPTVKYVDGEHVEEIDSRNPKDIKEFIKEKLGLTPETPADSSGGAAGAAPADAASSSKSTFAPAVDAASKKISRESSEPKVLELFDDNFRENVDGKHALVAFTTSWCGYCKMLAPHWDSLAKIYARDEDIVIVNVDCTDPESASDLMRAFEVEAFPTIVYIPAGTSEGNLPKRYSGPRDLKGLVSFFKDMGISNRESDGKLNDKEGIIDSLDLSVLPDFAAVSEQVASVESKFKSVWEKVLKKAADDSSYLTRESKRLGSILEGTLKPRDADTFQIKLNIINALQAALPRRNKDEL